MLSNHKGNDNEDTRIVREWEIFKTILETQPTEIDVHSKHVN